MNSGRAMMKPYKASSAMAANEAELLPQHRVDEIRGTSGRKSSCDWLPCNQPLPKMPPEPMAICD